MHNSSNMALLSVNCKKCGESLDEEWSFCPHCKSPIEEINCMHCGKKVRVSWKFCPYCTSKNNGPINKSVDEKSNDWLKNMIG